MSQGKLNWRKERLRSLMHDVHNDLVAYCRRRVPADVVDDVVSETWTIVWQRLDSMPEGAGARPWVFGVARNLIHRQYRDVRRQRRLGDKVSQQLLSSPATAGRTLALSDSQKEALGDAFASLKEDDREVIRLRAWEDLSHKEIASVMETSENAVNLRISRARRRLAKKLNADKRWVVAEQPDTYKGGPS